MFLFNYQVREPFTSEILEGDVFASNKTEAFNKIVATYTRRLNTSVENLQVSMEEVA